MSGVAWVAGASGTWGRAVTLELLRRGYDVVALGRRDVPELAAWAQRLGRCWSFARFHLDAPELGSLPDAPDVLAHCAVATDGDRATLVRANFLAPALLIEHVVRGMRGRGAGRVGVFLAQNARLGLAGLGDFSATQGALWTWCEALQEELAREGPAVTLTRVVPPRVASDTQRFVTERTGRRARLGRPEARPLVGAILGGRRRAGRRPLLASLATLFR